MLESRRHVQRLHLGIGEHTDAVLREIGYNDEDIAALRADAVV